MEKLSQTDYNQIFDNATVEDIAVETINIGHLNVPTGRIVVCDPLVVPDSEPLSLTSPTGQFPVKLYMAKTPDAGDRFAVAKLEFSTQRADKWVLALRDEEDLTDIPEDDAFFGFPVDAGLGGFFDEQAGKAYNRFVDNWHEQNPGKNIYDDFFAAQFKKNATNPDDPQDYGDWINFTIPGTNLNVTMFQSGYGDGVYPAYWGMTHDNEIVSLVIDFFVLLMPEGEDDKEVDE